jgi:hypothetical protein
MTRNIYAPASVADLPLFGNIEEGRRRRDEGAELAIAAADARSAGLIWKNSFTAAAGICKLPSEFTSEDITAIVGQPPEGVHPSTVGALMISLAKRGVIEKAGYVQAQRANQHATMLASWRRCV